MDNIDENFEFNSEDEHFHDNGRTIAIFISQINDCIYTHTDLNSRDSEQSKEEEIKVEVIQNNQINKNIIDISFITKGKNVEEIVLLATESIWPTILTNNLLKIQPSENKDIIDQFQNNQAFDENDPFSLKSRKIHQKLSDAQIRFLKFNIQESGLTARQISNEFRVSRSEIYRIKRMSLAQVMRGSIRKWRKIYGEDRNKLIEELRDFIASSCHAFNSNEVTNHMNSKFNENYRPEWIREIMKNDLNLTYKRIKPRPNNIDFNKVKACRQLFAIKFSQLLSSSSLVINIDETSINRHIKNNFSWSLKGKEYEAKNSPFIGSLNWIMAIWSNGNWLCLLMNQTSNSEIFSMFCRELNKWLNKNEFFDFSNVIVTMDNSSIHKWQNVTKILNKMKAKIVFLPAYSPQFAPIEMGFSIIKSKLRKLWNKGIVKLHLKSSIIEIWRSLKHLKSKTVKKLFKNMYSRINDYI